MDVYSFFLFNCAYQEDNFKHIRLDSMYWMNRYGIRHFFFFPGSRHFDKWIVKSYTVGRVTCGFACFTIFQLKMGIVFCVSVFLSQFKIHCAKSKNILFQ